MTRWLLVRHGATDWNHDGRYQGQSDTPLNQLGVSQAEQLAAELSGQRVAAVYSSDLRRASRTAEILAAPLGIAEIALDDRLREIHLGAWEGRLTGDIQREYAAVWNARRLDPVNVGAPGGETGAQVAERLKDFLEDVRKVHPSEAVLVVSHGYALASTLCLLRGLPLQQAPTLIPENAELIAIDWPADVPLTISGA